MNINENQTIQNVGKTSRAAQMMEEKKAEIRAKIFSKTLGNAMVDLQSAQGATGSEEVPEWLGGNNYLSSQSISNGNYGSMANETTDLDSILNKAAAEYDVPVNLLKAIAKAESNFNPEATSKSGAMGVMQLMPGTAKALGVVDPYNAEQNIMGGASYISQKLKQYDGNVELALAAYNAGSGNVKKYGGVPPFKETENYISKIMGYMGQDLKPDNMTLPRSYQDNLNYYVGNETDDFSEKLKSISDDMAVQSIINMMNVKTLGSSIDEGSGYNFI